MQGSGDFTMIVAPWRDTDMTTPTSSVFAVDLSIISFALMVMYKHLVRSTLSRKDVSVKAILFAKERYRP